MKSIRCALPILFFAFSGFAVAQPPAEHSFDQLKSLAGTWEGTTTTIPVTPAIQGKPVQVTMRVTSMDHALLHEIKTEGRPDDPITMFYVNGSHLYLRQYADFGNRPRMVASTTPHGETLKFSVVDVSGAKNWGYMEHAAFTIIDDNHHTEDWTFLAPGNHRIRVQLELHRVR